MAFDGTLKFDTAIDKTGFKLGLESLGSLASKGMAAVTAAVTAASGAVSALGGYAVSVGKNFESSMAQVIATMGITKDTVQDGVNSYDLLKEAAAAAGESTVFSASEAADALNYLALAGYDAATAVDALPAVLDLAAAGDLDLAYASDLATDAMAALGIEATSGNLTHFGDEMAKTASKANTSVAQLGEAILTVGGTAKSLAGGTTELNAALGVLANRGIKGAEGGTHLRNMILSLSAPTDTAKLALNSLGVSALDAEGNMRPLNEVFKDLDKALSGMSDGEKSEILSDIFNKTDLSSAQAMLAGCGEEFDALSIAIEGAWYSADSLDKALSGISGSDANVSLETLQSKFEKLGIDAEGFELALAGSNGDAKDFIDTLWEFSSAGTSYDDVLNTLGISLDDLQVVFDQTSGAMSQMAETMNDTLEGDLKSLGSKAEAFGIAVYDGINEPLRDLAQLGGEYISQLTAAFKEGGFEGLAESLGDVLGQAITKISEYLPVVLEMGASVVKNLIDGLISNIGIISESASQILQTIVDCAVDIIPDVLVAGMDIISSLAQGIAGSAPQLADAAISGISQLIDGFTQNLPEIVEAAISIASSFAESLEINLPQISRAAESLIKTLVETIVKNAPENIKSGISILTSLVKVLTDNVGLLLDSALIIIETIATALLENLDPLIDAAVQFIITLAEYMTENTDQLLETALMIIAAIASCLIENAPKLLAAAIVLFGSIVKALFDIRKKINDAIIEAGAEAGKQLVEIVSKGIDIIADGLSDMLISAKQGASDIVDGVAEFFSEIPGKISDSLSDTIESVVEWGSDLMQKGKNAAKDLVDSVVTGITSLPGELKDIGIEIVKGLWEGIKSMIGWLGDKISDFGSGIVKGFKKVFDINSPSRVMRDSVGKYIAQGVGVGFTEELPDIGKAAVDMFTSINFTPDIKALSDIGKEVLQIPETIPIRPDKSFSDIAEDTPNPFKPTNFVPDIYPDAVQAFEIQGTGINSIAAASATSEIINNQYSYSTVNNSESSEPTPIVLNAQFVVGEEVVAEGVIDMTADKIDEHQGIKIRMKKRGLA